MQDLIQIWNDYFTEKGVAPALKTAYIKYIEKLGGKGLPVIFELPHLAKTLGVKYYILRRMVNKPEAFYYEFSIPKRRGGYRAIKAPYPIMRFVQHWILHQILSKIKLHEKAFAYREGLSIVDNAKQHLGQKQMLKMDLKDFFPNIERRRIISIFQILGYSNKVSSNLATLCCYEEVLPQGACTSPYLSNIILKRLDKKIAGYAKGVGLTYSRYADDLTLSGEEIDESVIENIDTFIEMEGFKVNKEKTQMHTTSNKRIVTGVSISSGQAKLPKVNRRMWKQELFYIRKFGLANHLKRRNIKDPIYLERLIGKFNFWKQLEPENQFVLKAIEDLWAIKNQIRT